MPSRRFAYVWRYVVEEDQRAAFEQAYGPVGEWVQLFSQAEGYLETELLCEAEDEGTYLTIDTWVSKEARDAFRLEFAAEFEALDRRCEKLTLEEELLGEFYLVAEPEP